MVSPKLEEGVADRDSLARTGFPVLEHDWNMPVSKYKANILLVIYYLYLRSYVVERMQIKSVPRPVGFGLEWG